MKTSSFNRATGRGDPCGRPKVAPTPHDKQKAMGIIKKSLNKSVLVIITILILLGIGNYFIMNFKLNNLAQNSIKIISNVN